MTGTKSSRFLTAAALLGLLGGMTLTAAPSAYAQDDEGIPVSIKVLDPSGQPVPAAVVRHPLEEERHRVNTVTGEWSASILYLPDGTALVFEKGMQLKFEVSAPGYELATVNYIVRKRKNNVLVTLNPLPVIEGDDDDMDNISIGFGRSVPLDGTETPPPESDGE